ncbi:MAG TPA: hypothetical protein VI456_01985 [Polyangia bacterium]
MIGPPARQARVCAGLLVALGLGAQSACSTVPPPVVSPVSRVPLGEAVTWSVDWGYARAHIERSDGTIQAISGNGDSTYGNPDPEATVLTLPAPALASLHQVMGAWDTGEYAGWRRFGGTARVRIGTTAGGATTSLVSAVNVHWSLRGIDASLALEQSLPLGPSVTLLGRMGASYGLRDYDIQVPRDLDATAGHDNTVGSAHFDILRPDLRLEPLLGVVLGAQSSLLLSFQPYFVVARGAITSERCADCVAGVRLVDFAQDVGIALALTLHGG